MKTIRATISKVSGQGHAFARAVDGLGMYIHRSLLPRGARETLIGMTIEVDAIEQYDAKVLRVISRAPTMASAAKPPLAPRIDELPPKVANILAEPVRKTTKADRIRS